MCTAHPERQREVSWTTRVSQGRQRVRAGSGAGSYSRLIDSCITQLNARGPSRSWNESKEEEEKEEEKILPGADTRQMPARMGIRHRTGIGDQGIVRASEIMV